MTDLSYSELRQTLKHTIQLLFRLGIMPHQNGNLSVRLPETEQMLLASAESIAYGKPEQLMITTFEGELVAGNSDPSAHEVVDMHSLIYRTRPAVSAVIHTHSPHITGFALAHKPLPRAYEPLLNYGITHDIPVATWAPRGSQALVDNILEQLQRYPTTPAVLLANHGLLAFGRDLYYTAGLVAALEEAAELTLWARLLGGEQPFPASELL